MNTKLILSALALFVLSACQSHSPATSRQFTATEASSLQSSRCQQDYFSASASHRSRASAARVCDVQGRLAERVRRSQGREQDLPVDPGDPR
ncbi:MAG: hypothetical protein MRY76_13255 [Pseudomonadales bacterium]|nr:hypothetical protein [Pseudomonadales bacterium]